MLARQVVEPGQIWMGQSRDHLWRCKIVGLSAQAVAFETLARGARGRSRVRGTHARQWMRRGLFVRQFVLERDVL